jgi:hypothetical protein
MRPQRGITIAQAHKASSTSLPYVISLVCASPAISRGRLCATYFMLIFNPQSLNLTIFHFADLQVQCSTLMDYNIFNRFTRTMPSKATLYPFNLLIFEVPSISLHHFVSKGS